MLARSHIGRLSNCLRQSHKVRYKTVVSTCDGSFDWELPCLAKLHHIGERIRPRTHLPISPLRPVSEALMSHRGATKVEEKRIQLLVRLGSKDDFGDRRTSFRPARHRNGPLV
jgi:hypothetical protein